MYLKKQLLFGLFIALIASIQSCKKDDIEDPIIPNEEELITSLSYQLVAGTDTITYLFRDLDGPGGQDPEVTSSGALTSNTSYIGSLTLLNETETPADDISGEIALEAEEHQFFFVTNDLNLTLSYVDLDSNGNPLGLQSSLNTGDASEGTLSIILRHLPDKFASGVSTGDISNAGGETDIEVIFDVQIQ